MTILAPFLATIKYVYVGYDTKSVGTYQLYVDGGVGIATMFLQSKTLWGKGTTRFLWFALHN